MAFACNLIVEISQLIEDFHKFEEKYVSEARDMLFKINHNCDSYETSDGHRYNLNELFIGDIETIVGDMKNQNNIQANEKQQQELRDYLLAHNKYGPDNPYPQK